MPTRVLCCGTFDHLHPGHLFFLRQARELGSELVVVVARDENVKRIKGRYPDHTEEERRERLAELEMVDEARLGYLGKDFLRVVAEVAPDVIALGYDQQAPPGLREAFPERRIVVLEAHYPERYKSSLLRGNRPVR
ncbi:MAG: adenylyltransferase/cytidyltransferase family protein [Candidatus Latescibacterota bacterium]